MTPHESLIYAETLLGKFKAPFTADLNPSTFLDYAAVVADVIRQGMTQKQREGYPKLREFAQTWARMVGEYDVLYKADPMGVAYRPKNWASEAFHKSTAFIRYFRAGNRTSKTQSGYAEHYFVLTGQHPWRYFPPPPHNTFLISGLPFTIYLSKVFNPKLVDGETDNPVSPLFPRGGKWLHKYDERERTAYVACPACAEEGKAEKCWHQHSVFGLFTSENGPDVIEAFKGVMGHGDEHLPKSFYNAMKMRVMDTPHSCLIYTGTPLHGMDAWENTELAATATGNPALNRMNPDDPASAPYVEMFEISQLEANITDPDKVRALMKGMNPWEVDARIHGKPSPHSENPVFDLGILHELKKTVTDPELGQLYFAPKGGDEEGFYTIEEIVQATDVTFQREQSGDVKNYTGLRVWELPEPNAQYVIGADTALGLSPKTRDPSCAQVLKLMPQDDGALRLKQVAEFHGWINPMDYGDEVKKLGVFYNLALVVPENTGIGAALMLRLQQIFYPNIFRDTRMPQFAEFGQAERLGINTDVSTKGPMVTTLQQVISKRLLEVNDLGTIDELLAFEQERTESGLQTRYRGVGGVHDDRVMALALATWAAIRCPHLFHWVPHTGNLKRAPKRAPNPYNSF